MWKISWEGRIHIEWDTNEHTIDITNSQRSYNYRVGGRKRREIRIIKRNIRVIFLYVMLG